MAQFTITKIQDQTAVKFHHNLGPFDIFLLRESEESNNIRFFCPTHATPFLLKSAERRALKALINFGMRFGYKRHETLTFDDVLHILGTAKDVVERSNPSHYTSGKRYFWEN